VVWATSKLRHDVVRGGVVVRVRVHVMVRVVRNQALVGGGVGEADNAAVSFRRPNRKRKSSN